MGERVMSHLVCRCGEDMWNGQTPNDIEYWVYSDRQLDSILENDSISTLELAVTMNYNVWKCPKCSRLYVFERKNGAIESKAVRVYRLEEM